MMQPAWWLFILAGIGVGIGAAFTGLGGGFLVVPLLLWLGFSGAQSVGTSAMAVLIVISSATLAHHRLGNIDYKMALLLGAGGILGAQIGAQLIMHVSTEVFRKIFAAILAALAVYLLVKK